MLVFLRPRVSSRAVSMPEIAGSCKTSSFRKFPSRLSCRATFWRQTFHSTLHTLHCTLHSTLYMSLKSFFVFSWQAQHFGRVQLHFAWQAQHFRRHFKVRGVHVAFHIALFGLNVSHVHFWVVEVLSHLESLVFLWRPRVHEGSYKISPFRRFSSRLSCRFAWQAWRFVTFQPVLYRVGSFFLCGWRNNALHTLHSTLYTPHSTLYILHTPHSTLYTAHPTTVHFTPSSLHTLHSSLSTPHSALHTLHFPLHTPHSTLYTPHSTIYALDSALHTPHFKLHTLHFALHT